MKTKTEIAKMKRAEVNAYAESLQKQLERAGRIEKSANPGHIAAGYKLPSGQRIYGTKEGVKEVQNAFDRSTGAGT